MFKGVRLAGFEIMSWKTPKDTEVLSKGSKERAAVAAIKGGSGAPIDDLADILSEVVAEFRDAIAGRENALDTAGTLPGGLCKYARDLALWIFITRGIPNNDGIQTKERSDAAVKAEAILEDIRNGKVAIEPPTGWSSTVTQNWNSENKLVMRTHPVPPPSEQSSPTQPDVLPYANPDAPQDN